MAKRHLDHRETLGPEDPAGTRHRQRHRVVVRVAALVGVGQRQRDAACREQRGQAAGERRDRPGDLAVGITEGDAPLRRDAGERQRRVEFPRPGGRVGGGVGETGPDAAPGRAVGDVDHGEPGQARQLRAAADALVVRVRDHQGGGLGRNGPAGRVRQGG